MRGACYSPKNLLQDNQKIESNRFIQTLRWCAVPFHYAMRESTNARRTQVFFSHAGVCLNSCVQRTPVIWTLSQRRKQKMKYNPNDSVGLTGQSVQVLSYVCHAGVLTVCTERGANRRRRRETLTYPCRRWPTLTLLKFSSRLKWNLLFALRSKFASMSEPLNRVNAWEPAIAVLKTTFHMLPCMSARFYRSYDNFLIIHRLTILVIVSQPVVSKFPRI